VLKVREVRQHQDQQVLKVLKVLQDNKVLKVPKEIQDHQRELLVIRF